MDVFDYLTLEHGRLSTEAQELLSNPQALPRDQLVARSGRLFQKLKEHLEKQDEVLLKKVENIEELQGLVAKCREEGRRLVEVLNSVVLLHVDEPWYGEKMQKLVQEVNAHLELTENELFTSIKKHASPQELDSLNDALHKSVFGS